MRLPIGKALQNFALFLAAILTSYFILEIVFFRIALPNLPLNLHVHLPEPARALVQTSKSNYLPHDYVALLGDSYAEGIGDWLLSVKNDRTKPYHSAHVIHDLTGRDVVSFGHGPGGSAEGFVWRPTLGFDHSACFLLPAIEAPRQFVYYFFEGNDLEDNLMFLADVSRRYGDASEESVSRYLTERYAGEAAWNCHIQFASTLIRMVRFVARRYAVKPDIRRSFPPGDVELEIAGNALRVAPLFGPGLGLSNAEVSTALGVFDQSLRWAVKRWPTIPFLIVYIPSPLSIYSAEVTSKLGLQTFGPAKVAIETPQGVSARSMADSKSALICRTIQRLSSLHGARFIDSRSTLRAAAQRNPIHGPIDWTHLNETGYRILGELVASNLTTSQSPGTCDD